MFGHPFGESHQTLPFLAEKSCHPRRTESLPIAHLSSLSTPTTLHFLYFGAENVMRQFSLINLQLLMAFGRVYVCGGNPNSHLPLECDIHFLMTWNLKQNKTPALFVYWRLSLSKPFFFPSHLEEEKFVGGGVGGVVEEEREVILSISCFQNAWQSWRRRGGASEHLGVFQRELDCRQPERIVIVPMLEKRRCFVPSSLSYLLCVIFFQQ